MTRRFKTLWIVLLSAAPAFAHAQSVDLAFYQARILEVSSSLRAALDPALDADARRLFDEIVFDVPLSWETNAVARRTLLNPRVVKFNAGFLAVTDWLGLAMIADWDGHAGCLKEYTTYLSDLAHHNSRQLFRGRDGRHVDDFSGYAARSGGACAGALQEGADTQRHAALRAEMLDAVIVTVLLHEVAHHVLGHVSAQGNNLFQRRIREIDADRWAVRIGVSAGYELRPAVPLFLFLAATGGGTLEDDIRSSHPSGLRRVRDLLVQTRALLDSRDPVGAHVMDASIADLDRSLR